MRFALVGDHPDGLDMARALVASRRHQLLAYTGSSVGAEYLRLWAIAARQVPDLEEILADPAIDAVIVAGKPADRPAQLRRALQSERHVLCVHPADDSPDIAYEAAMIQVDTRVVLLPLLPEALHPAFQRLAELLRKRPGGRFAHFVRDLSFNGPGPPGPQLIEMVRTSTEAVLLETETPGHDLGVPGWDVLRLLGGEIVEIIGLAPEEEVTREAPLLLNGRFEQGGLFQATYLPAQPEASWKLAVRTGLGSMQLVFPDGWPGRARFTWCDDAGLAHEEMWDDWDPWAALVEVFEAAVAPSPVPTSRGHFAGSHDLRWEDEVRCLELDDAARRSVERRRASTLEYQEATEEAGFKGTMTLFGCSLLWGSLILLLLSVWLPWLGWLILPVFGLFLALQLLRWIVPSKSAEKPTAEAQDQQAAAAPSPGRESADS
jgi:predicted dehydrogenase